MNEETELWKELRRDQQQRRAERLPGRSAEIIALREIGYTVEPLTDYQFRIGGVLDLFPIHQRYHYIPLNKRGGYQAAIKCVQRFCRTPKS